VLLVLEAAGQISKGGVLMLIVWIVEALKQLILRIRILFRDKSIYECESCKKLFPFKETMLLSGILPYGPMEEWILFPL
jgi:hypothetical protein